VRSSERAALAVAAVAATVVAGCGSAERPAAAPTPRDPAVAVTGTPADMPALSAGSSAWVSVAVARLWQSPRAPRSVDRPALKAPVRFRAWLRAMSFRQRKALDLRSDTEALMGDRVVVVRLRPHWAKVVVPSQPSQKDPRGYPGWVPRRQLTAAAPASTTEVATVTERTAWLRTDDSAAQRVAEISFGTQLPVLGSGPGYVRVAVPGGQARRLADAAVTLHAPGTPALTPTRSGLTGTAKTFLGLPYLWGGLSGFGIDCSGLTWLSYRVHGVTTPRDALPQARAGTRVGSRLPGDLLFYASGGRVHHVSMYLGDGRVIHAPRTGQTVRVVAFSAEPLRGEYVGARRYLD
jgi:gamma-D-glutamyl-L-lysine dipeptidyl-peptidase